MTKKTISIAESLESIAIRLDELTGNAMCNSSLRIDSDPVDLGGVEDELSELNKKVDKLSESIDNVTVELQSLSTISETLENMLAFYIQFNETKNQ